MSSLNNLLSSIENVNKTTNDILIIYAQKIAFIEFMKRVENKESLQTELTKKINEHYGNKG